MIRPFVQKTNTLIERAVRFFLGKKVSYVSPFHGNVGDFILEAGCRKALCGAEVVSSGIYKPAKKPESDVIAVQGGGNFGDLYQDVRKGWLEVVALNPHKKVVFLPQSVFWKSKTYMTDDLKVMRKHPDLTIMVREKRSFQILSNQLPNIQLVPDFAFALGSLDISPSLSGPLIRVARSGVEALKGGSGIDWALCPNMNDAFCQAKTLLSGASYVISDRLHVHILCSIHGIPNTLVANAYHKNKSFFETWTFEDGVSRFAESWPDV